MTKQTNPEVSAKPTRRTFSAAEKRRILAAADALKAAGENLGPMLRREGLYRSQLSDWRKAIAARGDEGLDGGAADGAGGLMYTAGASTCRRGLPRTKRSGCTRQASNIMI
jgi:hypothetical protein